MLTRHLLILDGKEYEEGYMVEQNNFFNYRRENEIKKMLQRADWLVNTWDDFFVIQQKIFEGFKL